MESSTNFSMASDKPLIKSTIPGNVLGTVELSAGIKEISVFHDIFLRYAFREQDDLTKSIFRDFVNIYINAAKCVIADTAIRNIPESYILNTQWKKLTYTDDKPTMRDNDFRASNDEYNTYVEIQNSVSNIKRDNKPDVTIADRSFEYFILGVNNNAHLYTTDQIWFFTESKADDEILSKEGFTSFSLRRDSEPFDRLPISMPSTILWIDLKSILTLDEYYDIYESFALARQLTKLFYGLTVANTDITVNNIMTFLETKFHDYKSDQEVTNY